MAFFNSNNIPTTEYNDISDYILVNHISSDDMPYTMISKIENVPITIATDDKFGGLKIGFVESPEDDGLYALRSDEEGNGYFTVTWSDKYILSAEYKPELSAIQILINDKEGYKVINIDVIGLIDRYTADGTTMTIDNNIFSIREGTFLSGDYVRTDGAERYCLPLYRKRDGYRFTHTMIEKKESTALEENRLYYKTSDKCMFFKTADEEVDLITPTQVTD